ncbi:MAG: hypothetical protein FOGNACKC_01684 [Anaerolineae bacterium]|nr:hypothetical protein [Anaerolineae bacterium]
MIRHRTRNQVWVFDLFKLSVLLILALLLFYFWQAAARESAIVSAPTAAPPTAIPPTEPPTAAPEATATTQPATATPTPSPTEPPPAPAAPTINPLPAGLTAGVVELSGTGEPGSSVEIVANGQVIGTAPVGTDGTWSIAADLPDAGDYSLIARTQAAAGAAAIESEPLALSLSLPQIPPPEFSLPDVNFAAGGVALSGTGEPGGIVEIVANGQVIGTAPVGDDGTWSFTAKTLDPGDYNLSLRSLAANGDVLAESEAVAINVAAPQMAAPELTVPAEALPAGEVELSGRGEPGSEVAIVIDGRVVGQTTVGSDGTWKFTANLPAAGNYQIAVQALDAGGAVLAESDAATVSVTAPQIAVPALDVPAGDIEAGAVTLTGSGEPNSQVEVLVDGKTVGLANVSASGRWRLNTRLDEAGAYEVIVQAVDAAGAVITAAEPVQLSVVAPAPQAATPAGDGQAYIVQADDWLSKLADKFYGDMFTYPTIVDATNTKAATDSSFATITNPDLIEIGWKLWIPAAPAE